MRLLGSHPALLPTGQLSCAQTLLCPGTVLSGSCVSGPVLFAASGIILPFTAPQQVHGKYDSDQVLMAGFDFQEGKALSLELGSITCCPLTPVAL